MTALAPNRVPLIRISCYYRPILLAGAAAAILCIFWFTSRYPQLLSKATHVGQALPSMAWSSEVLPVAAEAPLWQKIVFGAVNWLASMRVGMTFGVLFGALLHTILKYYPLKVGKNLYINSLKGALVGAPAGVCANCAVPMACGVTRGHGRIEVALGFLFSSPNFNPVVLFMTFAALPLTMSLTKYAILIGVIVFVVPAMIAWADRRSPLKPLVSGEEGACALIVSKSEECIEPLWQVAKELGAEYGRNIWMLVKPTITLMLIASLLSAAILTLVPWTELLSQVTPARLFLVSLISTFMPVPIALDVMFAAKLHQQGVAGGYVMLFAMTLGTYSIVPTIYMWREVSKPLALGIFAFFLFVGCVVGLVF